MIYFFTPYSFEKKLFNAWKQYMSLIGDDDWACMMDGDTFFFQSNFGHLIQDYIKKYPDTGLFTCYASRSGFHWMMPKQNIHASQNIMLQHRMAMKLQKEKHLSVTNLKQKVTGHCMIIKKSLWNEMLPELEKRCGECVILNVDVRISNLIMEKGLNILLMEGMYMFHYYRMVEGKNRLKMLL